MQSATHAGHAFMSGGVVREVSKLIWVSLKVKELVLLDLRIPHEFPAIVPYHTLHVAKITVAVWMYALGLAG